MKSVFLNKNHFNYSFISKRNFPDFLDVAKPFATGQ